MLIRLWNILDIKLKIGFAAMLVLAVILMVSTSSGPPSKLAATMAAGGFTLSSAEDSRTRPGSVILDGISLDPDGFSMIGQLAATGGTMFPLFGTPERLTIDNLQLTGEWNEEQGLSFAGWSLPHANQTMNWAAIGRIILSDSIIDLDTPVGALRLAINGESARNPDNPDQQIFSAHLSGAQHQLVLDSQIKGTWSLAEGFAIETEIREARLLLDHLEATRVNGWLSLDMQDADNPVPTLSGQIQAGQFGRDKLKLNNVALTLDGPITAPHAIMNAELGGYKSAAVMLEMQAEKTDMHIFASIETRSMDDLISILSEFRTQAETSPFLQESLMALLITEGNLDRIRDDLKKDKYESYVLEIEGLSHDLTGKIIGKRIKNGVMQRQVFSLNPSVAAGGR